MLLDMVLIFSFTGMMFLMYVMIRFGEKAFWRIRRSGLSSEGGYAGESVIMKIREARRRERAVRRMQRAYRVHAMKKNALDKSHRSGTVIPKEHGRIVVGSAMPSRIFLNSKSEMHA